MVALLMTALMNKSSNSKQSIAATMSDGGSNSDALDPSAQDSAQDAFDSPSESSEPSSVFFYNRSWSRGRPRKRTASETWTPSQSRLKRLRLLYNDDYRVLFNSTVKDLTWNESSNADRLLHESQIGVTVWSSEEKGAFFHALARRGRHDIRGIATDIGTKSESEVYVYSDMLYNAAVDEQNYRTRKNLFNTSNLEAALEVQRGCCAALDLAAEALSALQQNEEEKSERKKHKEFALLTPRIARWTERRMAVPQGGNEEVAQRIPAATILNLMNFLTLSKRFFMNSVITEDNWRSYRERKIKSPSIMYTAFSDFHALLISITQRLVQSSLFFAMSRLRTMSASGHYTPESHVRRRDVIAAINVLGMKVDAKVFWARAARRCKLRVYENVRHRQAFGKRYSFVELERILSPGKFSDPDSPGMTTPYASTAMFRTGRKPEVTSASALEASLSSDLMSVDGGGSSDLTNRDELSATPLHSTSEQDPMHDGQDESQNAYAEALDQQASRNEECRLWEILGRDPAESMECADVKLPKRPFPNRKTDDELHDWRKLVDYAGIWETHEPPVFESSIAIHRGFIKGVDSAAGLTSSGSSSGSLIDDGSTEAEHGSVSDEDADGEGADSEGADGDGATNYNGANASSAYDAKHGASSNGSDSDRRYMAFKS